MIGYAFSGSHCSLSAALEPFAALCASGREIQPIFSDSVYRTNTRFWTAEDFRARVEAICGRTVVYTIVAAEPFGPTAPLEALIIAPCTGNTLAKLAHGITDTAVCMAAKAHLRCDRPLVIALASNDAMSANLENIAALLKRKSVYFVPLRQDDPQKKPHSLVADFSRIPEALEAALAGHQLRPLFL
ncbi:MAG: dipicolinate synthase subunit B [Clostridia bacterium]|nr:dipicolinate synthase subunit B [Clostridia bacterium]